MVQSVWGLGQDLVAGTMEADRFVLARHQGGRLLECEIRPKPSRIAKTADGGVRSEAVSDEAAVRPSLDEIDLKRLWEVGRSLERHFGMPLDIEWVIDPAGKLWVVQARRLVAGDTEGDEQSHVTVSERPLLEGGVSIHAGRASGPMVRVMEARLPRSVPEGSILVLSTATPEIATLLPFIAGCITETGNPAGHAATLLREWRLPCLFGLEGASGDGLG